MDDHHSQLEAADPIQVQKRVNRQNEDNLVAIF